MTKVLDHFHKHEYQQRGDFLWCKCGDVKNVSNSMPHVHNWKPTGDKITQGDKQVGWVDRCEGCGELKEYRVGQLPAQATGHTDPNY